MNAEQSKKGDVLNLKVTGLDNQALFPQVPADQVCTGPSNSTLHNESTPLCHTSNFKMPPVLQTGYELSPQKAHLVKAWSQAGGSNC
jgi:hypothetical protein